MIYEVGQVFAAQYVHSLLVGRDDSIRQTLSKDKNACD